MLWKYQPPTDYFFLPSSLHLHPPIFHTFKKGKWQYYNSNAGRFDFQRFHEGQHWYPSASGKIAADERAKVDAIEFLRERPKEKPFAMTVAL